MRDVFSRDLPITLDKTSGRELQKTPEANQGHAHLRGGVGSESPSLQRKRFRS